MRTTWRADSQASHNSKTAHLNDVIHLTGIAYQWMVTLQASHISGLLAKMRTRVVMFASASNKCIREIIRLGSGM